MRLYYYRPKMLSKEVIFVLQLLMKSKHTKTAARTTPKQNNSFKTTKNTGITDLWYIRLSLTILIKIRDILFSSKYRLYVPGRNAAKRWFRWAPTLYVLGKRKKSPSNQLFPWRWSVVGAQCMDMFTKRWIAFMLSSYENLYYRFPLITVYVRPPRTYDPKQTNLIFNITYTECTTLSDSFLCVFWVSVNFFSRGESSVAQSFKPPDFVVMG